jgi:hypothetical protein
MHPSYISPPTRRPTSFSHLPTSSAMRGYVRLAPGAAFACIFVLVGLTEAGDGAVVRHLVGGYPTSRSHNRSMRRLERSHKQ